MKNHFMPSGWLTLCGNLIVCTAQLLHQIAAELLFEDIASKKKLKIDNLLMTRTLVEIAYIGLPSMVFTQLTLLRAKPGVSFRKTLHKNLTS